MKYIDLNCDIGEDSASVTPREAVLLEYVTTANIACGGHAGDGASMRALVLAAASRGVAVGAHPSYADRAGFGRREIGVSAGEIGRLVREQVGALKAIAEECGERVNHVKPHGALYHRAETDQDASDAIVAAVGEVLPQAVVVGIAGGRLVRTASAAGLRAAGEAFADRGYQADGSLVPRGVPGALITDGAEAAARTVSLVTTGTLAAADGTPLRIAADTICIHGDNPEAASIAVAVKQALALDGIGLRRFPHPQPLSQGGEGRL